MTKSDAEIEAMQRELAELRKRFADAERESRKEIRTLERRIDALEQAGRRVDIAFPYLAVEAKR